MIDWQIDNKVRLFSLRERTKRSTIIVHVMYNTTTYEYRHSTSRPLIWIGCQHNPDCGFALGTWVLCFYMQQVTSVCETLHHIYGEIYQFGWITNIYLDSRLNAVVCGNTTGLAVVLLATYIFSIADGVWVARQRWRSSTKTEKNKQSIVATKFPKLHELLHNQGGRPSLEPPASSNTTRIDPPSIVGTTESTQK